MSINLLNPIFLALYFIAFWSGIACLISVIGGWNELARSYAAERPFQGEAWSFQNASMRFSTAYHNILKVGSNSEGLYLAMPFLFRPGHPPLFIPWRDISVQSGTVLWVSVYKFEFREVPSVPLRLREKLGKKVEFAAGASWPGDRSATGAAF